MCDIGTLVPIVKCVHLENMYKDKIFRNMFSIKNNFLLHSTQVQYS